jgi:hypothetical protein
MISLRENEKIIKSVRRHALFFVPRFVFWLVLIGLLFVWRYYGKFEFYGYTRETLGIFLLVATFAVLWKFYQWRRSIFMLTNQRVVYRVQNGVFTTMVTELLYPDIKELSYTKGGVWESIFNYGSVIFRTASESSHVMEYLPHPDKIVTLISKIR